MPSLPQFDRIPDLSSQAPEQWPSICSMTTPSRAIDTGELLAQMGWVQSLARSLVHDEGLAADVAQQTWLQALTRPPRATAGPGLRAWLATVTRTHARQHARSERRRTTRQQIAARPEAVAATVDVVERGAAQSRVVEVVMALDEPYRSTLLLRYLDELSFTEIAKQQSVSEAAVRKRVSRGVALVRDRMEADERDWSHALIALAGPAKAGAGLAALTVGGILMTQRWAVLGVAFVIGSISAWFLGDWSGEKGARSPEVEVVSSNLTSPADAEGDVVEDEVTRDVVTSGISVEVAAVGGVAVAGAEVFLFAGNEFLVQETTDESGSVTFNSADGPLAVSPTVIVARRGCVPERFAITGDLTRVVLAQSLAASGRVIFAVEEHAAPMQIDLIGDRPWPVFDGLSEDVISRLAKLGVAADRLSLDVEEDFSFEGLDIDWTGRIAVPEGFVLTRVPRLVAEDTHHAYLSAPRDGIELYVMQLPVVSGRLVRADNGEPVSGARVVASARFSGDVGVLHGLELSGDDGVFRIVLSGGQSRLADIRWAKQSLDRFAIKVQREFGGAELPLAVDLRAITVDTDLGELRVELAAPVGFRVEDESGAPIAQAFASTGRERSTRSDAEGRAVFRASPGEGCEITVVARGYSNTSVALRGQDTVVVMKKAATLDVKIKGVEASIASELRLHVKQSGLLFFSGISFVKMPDENGEVSLTGLATDKKTTLTLRDRFGELLGQQTVEALRGTEHRRVEFELATKPYSLIGYVADSRGRPLPRVLINILLEGNGDMTRSDADGRFSFDGLNLTGKKATLVIERSGFMPQHLKDIELRRGMDPLHVTLERGRIVTLIARHADGRPVGGLMAISEVEGRSGIAKTQPDGRADLTAVPFASGYVGVEVGGKRIQVGVTADQLEAVVIVPVLGRADVYAEVSGKQKRFCRVTITPVGRPEQQSYLYLKRRGASRGGVRSLSLIPGEYKAVVQTWDKPKKKEALGGVYEFTVRPDETAELRIDIR